MKEHCCERMAEDFAQTCSVHANRSECPDALIGRIGKGYGIRVHDGGSSVIEISFCPWCGTRLPAIDDTPDGAPIEATAAEKTTSRRIAEIVLAGNGLSKSEDHVTVDCADADSANALLDLMLRLADEEVPTQGAEPQTTTQRGHT